jgi:hypothetical protein
MAVVTGNLARFAGAGPGSGLRHAPAPAAAPVESPAGSHRRFTARQMAELLRVTRLDPAALAGPAAGPPAGRAALGLTDAGPRTGRRRAPPAWVPRAALAPALPYPPQSGAVLELARDLAAGPAKKRAAP